ncbi:unnamed protein product [Malus baccata var. baccata]
MASVACDYSGRTIAFHVDQGSNPNYFGALKETSSSDGGGEWRAMQQSWGAVWKLDAGAELHPPLSIRLTSLYSDETLLAKDVIPVGWKLVAINLKGEMVICVDLKEASASDGVGE